MRKSIKIMAGVRVVAALLAVMVFSVMTTKNIYNMEDSAAANVAVNEVLQRAQKAERKPRCRMEQNSQKNRGRRQKHAG